MRKPSPGLSWVVFILLMLSTCPPLLFSQDWMARQYTGMEGLGSSLVFDITQDFMGRIWAANRGGISCYDGISWKTYTDVDGLPGRSLMGVQIDARGHVWVLGDFKTGRIPLAVFNGETWRTVNLESPVPGKTYRVTRFLLMAPPAAQEPIIILGTASSGLLWWERDKWYHISTRDGLLSNRVNGLAMLGGKCFAATSTGLSVISRDRSVDNSWNSQLKRPTPGILGIGVEHKDKYNDSGLTQSRLWMYSHNWLGYLNEREEQLTIYNVKDSFRAKDVAVKVLPDYRNGVYLGNAYELFYFNFRTQRTRPVSVDNGMVGSGCNALFLDFERNVWVACDRGLTKISGRHFSNFQSKHGLLEDEVTAVVETEPGKYVLGHNQGFSFYDGCQFKTLVYSDPLYPKSALNRVLDLAVDKEKNLWSATSTSGLVQIRDQKVHRVYGTKDGLPEIVSCVWLDGTDRLWVGTRKGLFYLSETGFKSFQTEPFERIAVRRIYGRGNQLRYLASEHAGLYEYKAGEEPGTGTWVHYPAEGYRLGNDVYSVMELPGGELLVGTGAGLYHLQEGKLHPFRRGELEIRRPVFFISDDGKGGLWFGTDTGLVFKKGRKVIRYSIRDGLVGQETNRAAGYLDSGGLMWFGTNRGLSVYDSNFDNRLKRVAPPRLALLDARIGEDSYRLDHPIRLGAGNHDILFRFQGISLVDEHALLFRHKLEGFETDWLPEHYPYEQAIRYSNLPPGKYRLHLKARNSMGAWCEPVISEPIIIPPPFHRRWWFVLLVILSTAFLIFSLARIVIEYRSASKLEKLVEERTTQLQSSEKQYRELFEESKDAVFTASRDGRFLALNPAGKELFGYSGDDSVLDVDIRSQLYWNPSDRDQLWRDLKEKGYVKDYEVLFRKKTGEKVTTLLTATAIFDKDGELLANRGILRDTTETRRLQHQLGQAQKLEAIGQLAGGIAHDFNNILAVITGYIELSLDDLSQESRARKDIEQVLIAASRARELITQILTFSRQSAEERRPLKAEPIVKEVLKLLRSSLPSTIEMENNMGAPNAVISAAPTQVHQVMMNLCTNAAHAMRDGGGLLKVDMKQKRLDEFDTVLYSELHPGLYLEISVTDTGHGIEPSIVKRIFDPYFTTKKQGEGTGMGLAVTHGIVKSCGGDITVYSEQGRGTTFRVLFPMVEGEAIKEPRREEDVPAGNGEHILVVDDEPMLVEMAQLLLEKLGYTVTGRTSSTEALEVFRSAPDRFALVISDLTMPHMTGLQLTAEIKKSRPNTPVIICTGFSESITQEQIASLGIHDLLMKPVTKAGLARSLHEALKEK